MKQIGEITISYKEYKTGICYYDFIVEVEGTVRRVTLPRHHAFIGWIEIFGLPPQNEWVVLADIEAFSKTAELIIDDQIYTESFVYTPDKKNKTHTIEVVRTNESIIEKLMWTESYKDAPNSIENTMKFVSGKDEYLCTMQKSLIIPEQLDRDELEFVTGIFESHGDASCIWKKSFTAKGVLPELYYTIFPQISGLSLTDMKGTVVEIGYMAKGDEIDAVHGDWYKRFQLEDGQVFYVNESGYTSRIIETENGPQKIKDTYCKKLYK